MDTVYDVHGFNFTIAHTIAELMHYYRNTRDGFIAQS